MSELSPEVFRLLNGLTHFTMGLAVVACASTYPTSSFRNRLLALGAFGLFHAAAGWVILLFGLQSMPPFYHADILYIPRSLALYYFAFGWNERRPMMAHAIVLASICGLVIAHFLIADPEIIDLITGYGVAIPASVCTALVFAYDSPFRFGSRFSDGMRWFVASGFLVYAVLQIFSDPASLFPASVLNRDTFEAVTGVSARFVRSGSVLVIMIGTLALLNRFGVVMRQQTEGRITRARDALAITELRLKKALNISKLGGWNWNIATGEVDWSNRTYRIFGLRPRKSGAIYPACLERVHPDDRAFVEKKLKCTLAQHTPFNIDHRIIMPDGAVRIVNVRGEVEIGPGRAALRMLGTVLDVTELVQTKEALRDKDAKLSRILEVSPEAIIVTDENAHIVLFNEGAQNIFGYSMDETVGRSIEFLIPGCFRATHQGNVRAFAATPDDSRKTGDRGEITALRKNGEEFPAEATISKLKTSDGLTFTVCLRDVSEAKAIQKELLAAKVAAEAASAAKTNFIANMSHELRTPLNAILGFSEAIETELYGPHSDPRYRGYAADVHKSGQHLLAIINDILSVSQLEAGKTKLDEEAAIDVKELLRKCLCWLDGQASEAGIALRFTVASGVPALRGDLRLLTQVLLNLLSNAVKFTPREGVVEIVAWETEAGGVTISVQDTGVGMTPDQIIRIGEPFLQFDNSMRRKFSGTGLGLSIAKQLVRLHGGNLEVESRPGMGTTVSVNLPPERSVRCLQEA